MPDLPIFFINSDVKKRKSILTLGHLESSLSPSVCAFHNGFCPFMQEVIGVEDYDNQAQDSDDSEQIIAGWSPYFVLF